MRDVFPAAKIWIKKQETLLFHLFYSMIQDGTNISIKFFQYDGLKSWLVKSSVYFCLYFLKM